MSRSPTKGYYRLSHRGPPLKRYSNYCLWFDASGNNYVDCGSDVSLDDLSAFTWESWLYQVDRAVSRVFFSKYHNIYVFTNGTIMATVVCATTSASTTTSTVLPLGVWRLLHMTYDDAGDRKIHVYLKGVECVYFSQIAGVGAKTSDAASSFTIGGWAGNRWYGGVDEVRVIPAVLTQRQRLESLYRGYALRELDARLVLRMEEGSGLTAYDESGYGNKGSLLPALTPPVWTPVRKHELLAEAGV